MKLWRFWRELSNLLAIWAKRIRRQEGKREMVDSELESYKRIDLRAYAASQGYVLDRKESWSGSAVMRDPAGDKIIIKRDGDGHYVFFSVRDDRDHGSIVDFVQRRKNLTLGAVRKELRQWTGTVGPVLPPYPPLVATRKDRVRVEQQFAKMTDAARHPYLEDERRIPVGLLTSERFAGRVRIDGRGNAVFPHFDREGLCGYEVKNRGFTSFSPGGRKGLWRSHEFAGDDRLVLCESAIDALSYAVLFPADDHTRFASIGGQLSPAQPELIRAAAAAMPKGAAVVAAMDADAAGRKLAEVVREAVGLTGRDDLRFVSQEPVGVKDWNDRLRGRARAVAPARQEEPSVA
jgi:hypothetical protein